MKHLPLKSFRLQNFKAVKDSKTIKFTPLTVFIGNNGSGKSSLIEGLETFQNIVTHDLDYAMQQWKGIDHILNKKSNHDFKNGFRNNPIKMNFSGNFNSIKYTHKIEVNKGNDDIFIQKEELDYITNTEKIICNRDKEKIYDFSTRNSSNNIPFKADPEYSIIDKKYRYSEINDFIHAWQFISLSPEKMGDPKPQKKASNKIKLEKDGSNIAEYLLSIRNLNKESFEGIIDALQYVLPYAKDLQAEITSEIERNVYLQLNEENFKIPSWLFSTGTLRILALLSILRHPDPPKLILIEEIENGLDPRTINFILEEIRIATESGIQVILTTHSPYLLDLIPLEYIVFVERYEGETIFTRPSDQENIKKWAEDFSSGRLYTMGKFLKRN